MIKVGNRKYVEKCQNDDDDWWIIVNEPLNWKSNVPLLFISLFFVLIYQFAYRI